MSERVVFDASAFLAMVNEEKGAELAENYLPNAVVSAINYSEILTILQRVGVSQAKAIGMVIPYFQEIIPFSRKQAELASKLYTKTKSHGLSLGDRACLALAMDEGIPTITMDKAWTKLKLSCRVICLR